jgi:hypothetical protein
VQRFTEFLQQVVLDQVPGQAVILIDEIDSTLGMDFTDDFFLAIRAVYNQRARSPENKRLTFVLSGVARSADLIKDPKRTPYNIGRTISMDDFDRQNVQTLRTGLERVFANGAEAILDRVLYWSGGHPYLTQKICEQLAALQNGALSDAQVDGLVARLFFQERRLQSDPNLSRSDRYVRHNEHRGEMLQVYRDILSGERIRDEEESIAKSQLKLSGLVKANPKSDLVVRNRVYERIFDLDWVASLGAPMPELDAAERRTGAPEPQPARPAPARRPGRMLLLAAPLVALLVVIVVGLRYIPFPTTRPTVTTPVTAVVIVPSTPTPHPGSPTSAPTPDSNPNTPTLTFTPVAPTETPVKPEDTSTPTATPTRPEDPTSTPEPPPTATFTPTPTWTTSPTPIFTPTFTPAPISVVGLPGAEAVVIKDAAVFVQPYNNQNDLLLADENIRGYIQAGEPVQVIGRGEGEAWDKWWYVRRADGVEGFVAPTYLDWLPLELIGVTDGSMCEGGIKNGGINIRFRGGNGQYVFRWEDLETPLVTVGQGSLEFVWNGQPISVREIERQAHYMVVWPWGVVVRPGKVTVESGDERVEQGGIWLEEPSCDR